MNGPDPLTEYRLGEAAVRDVIDERDDCADRLARIVATLPARERARYAGAAKTAGEALELLKPSIIAMPREGGMLAGAYSEAGPGDVLVLAASTARTAYSIVGTGDIDEAAAWVAHRLAQPDAEPDALEAREQGGLLVLTARAVLAEYGAKRGQRPGHSPAAMLAGLALERPEHREFVRGAARHEFVPAMVCLLARDRRGAVLVPLVHGKAFPVVAFAEAQGIA